MSRDTHTVTRSTRATRLVALIGTLLLVVLIAAPWWAGGPTCG